MAKTAPNMRLVAGRRVAIDRPKANDALIWDEARQEYVPKPPGSVSSPLTTKGDVYTRSASADARLGVGTNGQVLSADSTASTGLKWIDAPAGSSPLTAKGDLYTRSASADDNLPVGTNGQVLTADSAQTLGIKWAAANALTTKGDVLTRTASAEARLPVGTDGQVLTADSAQTNGIKWATPSTGGIATGAVLPTAGSGYRATLFMLEASGQPDRLYCCGLKADGSTYEWRELVIFGP